MLSLRSRFLSQGVMWVPWRSRAKPARGTGPSPRPTPSTSSRRSSRVRVPIAGRTPWAARTRPSRSRWQSRAAGGSARLLDSELLESRLQAVTVSTVW